jgi:hypothetical protein
MEQLGVGTQLIAHGLQVVSWEEWIATMRSISPTTTQPKWQVPPGT